MRVGRLIAVLLLLFQLCLCPGFADEIRPAFLEFTQQSETVYQVLWKRPSRGEAQKALKLEPIFPPSSQIRGVKKITTSRSAVFESYLIEDEEALINKPITIQGLQTTTTDVLVRVHYLDGATEFIRILPENPQFSLTHKSGFLNMVSTYFVLGVQHILEGYDHLLFVLALLLLVGKLRVLFWTITAFTLAHTLTLMLASLDLIQLSGRAVESIIALSIVFVAAEVVYAMRGQEYLSKKYPWLIAFGFGLIHGLGFAGALKEIGLPQNEIVPALIFFNVGVEAGQVIFLAAVILLAMLFKPLIQKHRYFYKMSLTYGIGIIASVWLLQRVLAG